MIDRLQQPYGQHQAGAGYIKNRNGAFVCLNNFLESKVAGQRRSNNVELKNFLFESDDFKLADLNTALVKQLTHIENNIELGFHPVHVVFSGNRSVHAIYAVKDQPQTLDEYKFVHKLLGVLLNYGPDTINIDRACTDPCRLTRRPNWRRWSPAQQQEVVQEELIYSPDSLIDLDWRPEWQKQKQEKVGISVNQAKPGTPMQAIKHKAAVKSCKDYLEWHKLTLEKGQRHVALTKLTGFLKGPKHRLSPEQITNVLRDLGVDQAKLNELQDLIERAATH